MATAYPSGIDDFTNPLASDSLDSVTVPHATQHSDANDAIEAIETTLGINPQGEATDVAERLDDIEGAVGDLQDTVDTATTGLVDRVGALETGLGDPIGSDLALVLSQISGEASDELVAGTEPGEVDDTAVVGYVKITVNAVEYAFPVYAINPAV